MMEASTFITCHGAGTLESGQYEDCYPCGGGGYGSHTNISCSSCGGSGRSSAPVRETCWNCLGAGCKVTEGSGGYSGGSKGQTQTNRQTKSSKKSSSLSATIGWISLVLASIVAFILYQDQTEVEVIIGTFLIVGIGFFIALHVLYYAVKIGIILVS